MIYITSRNQAIRMVLLLSARDITFPSLLLLLLTLGFGGVRIADLRTILFTLLAAITVFMNLTGTKQDKEKSVL